MATRQDLREHLLVISDMAEELGYHQMAMSMRAFAAPLAAVGDPTMLDIPLWKLEWSTRALNVFQRYGVEYVGQLIRKRPTELLKLKNFGRKTLREVEAVLENMGLSLGVEVGEWKAPQRTRPTAAELEGQPRTVLLYLAALHGLDLRNVYQPASSSLRKYVLEHPAGVCC